MAGGLVSRALGMITRMVTTIINDAPKMQTVQGLVEGGEPLDDDTEHYQPYGFTAVVAAPDVDGKGPEGILLAPGGDRSQAIVICVADRRYRLKALAAGEVALYDDIDQRVHLTRTGIVIDAPNIQLGIGATLGVARVGDTVDADTALSTWIGLVSTATGVAAPANNESSITTGSAVVKAVN